MENYITLQEATQKYRLLPQLLTQLVTDGKIRGGKLNGTYVLSEKDTRQVAEQRATKEDLRKKVAHLEGQAISLGNAARKYNLRHQSISRWTSAGYIRVLDRGGHGRPTIVDESDVAYAKELVRLFKAGQGKQVFTPEYAPDWF